MTGPGIIDNVSPVVQRIPGNVGQCVPQVGGIVKPERLYFDSPQDTFFAILVTEVHRIDLFTVFAERLRVVPLRRQGGGVRVIGDDRVGNDDHIVPPGANGQHLHHHVIILIVTA